MEATTTSVRLCVCVCVSLFVMKELFFVAGQVTGVPRKELCFTTTVYYCSLKKKDPTFISFKLQFITPL